MFTDFFGFLRRCVGSGCDVGRGGPVRLLAALQVDRDRQGRVSDLKPVFDPGPEVKLVSRDRGSSFFRWNPGELSGNPDDIVFEQNRLVSGNVDNDLPLSSSSGSSL